MGQIFYCYSYKMALFIRSFGVKYVSVGENRKTHMKYYTFEKNERLDKIINFYNEVKHKF